MVFAVVHDDTNIDHRVAGNGAMHQHFAHALFHRRHVLAGNGAALDLINKLKPGATRQGLDAQEDLAKLARTTRLLFVPVVALGIEGDGFTVGDLGRPDVDLKSVHLLQPCQQHAQVQLTQTVEHRFVRGSGVFQAQTGVFRHQLAQHFPQPLFVASAFGVNRQAVHRNGQGQGL